MTTSEIDRLSRILTDMRVESAGQFARLDERLKAVPDLLIRVAALEAKSSQSAAQSGRVAWSDMAKLVAAAGAVVALIYTVTHW